MKRGSRRATDCPPSDKSATATFFGLVIGDGRKPGDGNFLSLHRAGHRLRSFCRNTVGDLPRSLSAAKASAISFSGDIELGAISLRSGHLFSGDIRRRRSISFFLLWSNHSGHLFLRQYQAVPARFLDSYQYYSISGEGFLPVTRTTLIPVKVSCQRPEILGFRPVNPATIFQKIRRRVIKLWWMRSVGIFFSPLVMIENMGPLADRVRSKSKQALLLWLDGIREACCLHRVIIYSLRSKQLAIRTSQCFLLNGLIFLGSIFVMKSVIIPALEWILPGHCRQINSQQSCSFSSILEFHEFLRVGLVQLFYVFWFYPLYIFSLILSNIWYNDIAKYGFFALENYGAHDTKLSDQNKSQTSQNTVHRGKSTDLEGVMINIAEQLYSVLLLTFFFMEVYVAGFIPYLGKALNFMLLSWLYAYYCFEYKWNLSGLSLDKRLDFFESNWAFFAGFGNPCVLAIFLFSPLVSCGVMAILFPLFVLTATGSEADKIVALPRRKWRGAGLGRVPIFFIADYMSMRVLKLCSLKSGQEMKEDKAL